MRKSKGQKSNGQKAASQSQSDEEYEVEEIMEKRLKKGKVQYLVRWKGYTADDDTWQDSEQLQCPDLIAQFEENDKNEDEPLVRKNKGKKKKGRPSKASGNAKKAKLDASNEEEDEEDPTKEYEVQKILEVHNRKDGTREFLVRWKGYGKDDDTWEPENHLSCDEMITNFMKKVDKAKESNERETRVNRKATDRYIVATPDSGRKLSARNRGPRRTYYEDN